ncbi:MAG: ATP-binding protein [Myxococcales bacterium]
MAERTAELARINQGMRLVLDNVEQGFITIDLEGVMAAERSTVCDRWFGASAPNMTLMDLVSLRDSTAASWIGLGLSELREDLMPVPLILDQMPSRMRLEERTMRFTYQPIYQSEKLADKLADKLASKPERLLVVVTDVTQELMRERAERDSREIVRIFQSILSDRSGFMQFLDEIGALVDRVATNEDAPGAERRNVHTIKGNCDLYGLESLATLCHDLETTLRDENRGMNADERRALSDRWQHVRALVRPLLGEGRATIELEEHDYRRLLSAIRAGASANDLAEIALSWRRESVDVRFARLADKARYLAERIGKAPVVIHQDAHGLRLDAVRWNGFWSAAVHAINNAVDHGIEPPERRLECDKAAAGNLWFEAEGDEQKGMLIRFRDDGGGVDWAQVAEKARQRGLPYQGHEALVEALFADGISTREEASMTSGRGTGMGALRETVRALGGRMDITSRLGHGTIVECRFPPQSHIAVNAA